MTITAAAQAARQHARQGAEQNPADEGWTTLAEMDDDSLNFFTNGMTEPEAVTWASNQRDWINDLAQHEN